MAKLSKKQRLQDAAAQLFWTKGYSGASLADVAAAAGVPLGGVYYYYKSKSALALAVAGMFVNSTKAALEDIEARTAPHQPSANGRRPERGRIAAFFAMLEQSHASRAKFGCPIARAIADFAADAPEAAHKAAEALTLLAGFLGRELARAGHPSAMPAAQGAIALWQGAIVLAHGAQSPQTLLQLCAQQQQKLLQELPQSA